MYWTALLLGLAGSLHCAGMCGPLALALPHPGGGLPGFLAGRVLYQLGRLSTYAVLGGLAGLIGRSLALAGVQRWVSITAGVLMLLGLVATTYGRPGQPVLRTVEGLKRVLGKLLQRRSLGALFLLGQVNGLLPCGLVYAACAGAAATGGLLTGSLYVVLFGLGTVPMLLALSLSGRAMPVAWRFRAQRFIPYSVGLVGLLLILRGMELGIPWVSPVLGSGAVCH
jgi:sulfite exporter TauE/SafE